MGLADKSAVGGQLAPFFKPQDYAGDLALIFEPKLVKEQVPGPYGPRDQVTARLTVFRNQPSLDTGTPSNVLDVTVNTTLLAKDLKKLLADAAAKGDHSPALVVVLGRYKPKGGGNEAWVFKLPRDDDYEKAVAYYDKREAELRSKLDAVPDFE